MSSMSTPPLPRDDPASAAPCNKAGCWEGPGKITTVVNGLTFRSTWCSGNLARVVLPAEQGGVGGVYQLWTARDCEGGPNARRNSSWFYYGVAGGSANQIITMRIMNLNNQNALYKHGMTPVFRMSGNPNWARLKQKAIFEEEGRHLQLQFQFRFTRDWEEVLFAFCFPYSYDDCNKDLECCEDQACLARRDGMAVQPLITPRPGPTGYFHRELLIRTPEGRRIDLLTVTDCSGILNEREPQIDPHLFPEHAPPSRCRPFDFEGKDVVFVSARVHPGETPASFVFQGILRFLLEPNDPRAAELRRRFVFKLVPLLNPDGIAAGHFRQDSYGNNLNRHYIDPDVEKHSSVYASKAVVMHHATRPSGRGRLTLYLDLHAHASARGCFIYGNHLPSLEDQAENQLLPLLMTLNTPHFDFGSCNFTLKHMCRVDSGDAGLSAEGTGRVFYGKHAGVLRSYTLECNYNTGKAMCNHIPPANGGRRGERFASPERKSTTPPRYHPQIWRDVGAGFLKALLDAEGASVWSRLPQSKFRSLERARKHLINELRNQPSYREQSLLLRRGGSLPATPPLPTPPQEPGPRRKRRGSTESAFGGGCGSSPPLSGQSSNLDKAPAATITADLAGAGKSGGGATASSSETDTSRKLSSSRPPPPLLPRRPVGRKVSTSRSRSEESVHGTSSQIGGGGGGGGGMTVVPTRRIGSDSSGSRSGRGRSSSRAGESSVSCKSGATRDRAKAAARRKPPSPNPGRCRSASREARRGQQSTGRSKRGNGSSSSGRGRGRGVGKRGDGDDSDGGKKGVRSSSSRSERRRAGGASTSRPSSRGRSAAALDRTRHVHCHSKKQQHRQRLQKAPPPLVVPLLPKHPVNHRKITSRLL
ncbi:unnamed protein product [Ectocarpus sp. 12 AP-2014]